MHTFYSARMRITLMIGRADDTAFPRTDFVELFAKAFDKHKENFFKYNSDELAGPDCWLALVRDAETNELVAGVRAVPNGGELFFGPCFTLDGAKGRNIVPVTMASLRVAHASPTFTGSRPIYNARLVVRKVGNRINPPAVRAYEKCGFSLGVTQTHTISGTRLDRHLLATSDDGATFQTVEMTADASSLKHCLDLARPLLEGDK